jgi:hypothetical protein
LVFVSALVAASASSVAARAATPAPHPAPHPSTAPHPSVAAHPSPTTTAAATTPTPATTGSAALQQSGRLGQTLLLARGSGGPIAVTLVKVVNPDTATDQQQSPQPGEHLESLEFHIKNEGTTPYQEDPYLDINASDDDATIVEFADVTATAAGPQLPQTLDLAPGASATGFVTFDVLEGDNISSVVYALNGGLYGSSANWQLG